MTLKRFAWSLLAVALVLGGGFVYWNVIREPDWRASAISDVDFIRETILNGHPGSVDPDNPAFRATLEAAHRAASALALRVEDGPGYLYAVRAMTAPMQDAHLVAQFYKAIPRQRRWPGFLVASTDEGAVAVTHSVAEGAPPVGARLLDCDGLRPDELYAERITPWVHVSWLTSERARNVPWLLIDSGNPFVEDPPRCRFEEDREIREYALAWQDLDDTTLAAVNAPYRAMDEQVTGLRFIGDGIAWVSAASFLDSEEGGSEALEQLVADIEARHDEIAAADALVVDVRGNAGGSSAAGYRIAEALWGEDHVTARLPRFTSTDWRASDENLDRIDGVLLPLRLRFGADSALYRRVSEVAAGLEAANAAGDTFFVQRHESAPATDAAPRPLPEKVFFLTDRRCVSACLDFADLMLALEGVVHIGAPTLGDTRYLEVVGVDLPSGIGQLVMPTAVHRGRERADNAVHVPDAPYPGDITDTEAIAAWIRTELL